MKKYKNLKKLGFTLIELLVVISIIGLLSSIVLASLNTARAKARDAKRIADIKSLQSAIELYASDHNGDYPGDLATHYQSNSGTVCTGINNPPRVWTTAAGAPFDATFQSKYMKNIPDDPAGDSGCFTYIRFTGTTNNTAWTCYNGSADMDPDGYGFSGITPTPSPTPANIPKTGPTRGYLITYQPELSSSGSNFPSLNSAGAIRKCILGPAITN